VITHSYGRKIEVRVVASIEITDELTVGAATEDRPYS